MPAAVDLKALRDAKEQALPQEVRDSRSRKRARKRAMANKTFEQLTPPEKDRLLKTVAIRLGLIQDSEDS